MEDINKLKVTELRQELQNRGLDIKGLKPVLVERLRKSFETDATTNPDSEVPNDDSEEQVDDASQEEEVDEGSNLAESVAPDATNGFNKSECEDDEQNKEEFEEAEEVKEVEPEQLNLDDVKQDNQIEDKEEQQIERQHQQEIGKQEQQIEDQQEQQIEDQPEQQSEGDKEGIKDKEMQEDNVQEKQVEDAEINNESIDVKEENTQMKQGDMETDLMERRKGEKRSLSPHPEENKRPRLDVEEVKLENEPEFDESLVVLDWYNSDLSLIIEDNRLIAAPLVKDGFAYVWHGARATYGVQTGKVWFEIKVLDHLSVVHLEESEQHPHVLRVGWSVDSSSIILGEEPRSWGFGGTGKASTNLKFKDYGKRFGKGDTIGCFLNLDTEPAVISYTINGDHQGLCFEIYRRELKGAALFPHVLTKNCSLKANFGGSSPAFQPLSGYSFISNIPIDKRELGTSGPQKRSDAEIIMMVGLPAAGKSTWVEKYCIENPGRKYYVLGTNTLIDKMKVMGLPRKRNYSGRWETLIEKCTRCLNKLLSMSSTRRRNFIIDQTNVYPSAQRRKMKGFEGFLRRAVVICPTEEELKQRTEKREKEEGKDVPDKAILEMKANFKLPTVGESFDSVEFIELEKNDSEDLIQKYNKEGEAAGFGPRRNSRGGYQAGKSSNYGDRSRRNNNKSPYRGGWDRDRDRRGGFDRRDRGSWNRDNNRDNYRSSYNRDNRSGGGGGYKDNRGSGGGGSYSSTSGGNYSSSSGGGGYNRDRYNRGSGGSGGGSNSGGGSSSGWQSGYRSGQQSNQNTNYSQGSWDQQWNNDQGWGGGGQNYNTGYNWNQQYYGQQQQQPQPAQQQSQQQQPAQQQTTQQQQYWSNQAYSTPQQQNYTTAASTAYGTQAYANTGYGYSQQASTPQQQQQSQQQWSNYNTGYNYDQNSYNRK